ncbi:MAG: NAD-glutamate dehydrogenase [Hyphomicrobiaceae bacterium]|nr:NAD-glutamate dehydrogenase [Hyphomicrobiaceae bacterium]
MSIVSEPLAPSLLDAVAALIGDGEERRRGLDLFARLLLASTGADSLADVPPVALAREAAAAFAAMAMRPRGQHAVTTRTSEIVAGGVVVQIVNEDMPFLLDSVLAEVQARGLYVALVLHPILKVERSEDGALIAVTGAGDAGWGDGRQESYIALHLVPRGGPLSEARREELAAAVSGILDDVRLVVVDWKAMLTRLSGAIQELSQAPVTVTADALDEQLAFLAWLAEGNFTFLGTRDYQLEGAPETGELVTSDSAGLGLLRDPEVRVLRRGSELVTLTPEVRQFFFSPDPLIITKANVISRIHRRVHMDYVGVKRYAPDGRVAGELRIVGLFTSSAYTQSPVMIPVLRRKAGEVVARLGYPADSHAGKALANVLATFPRDELFQIGIEDLVRWADGILDLELRPRVRLLARYDRFDRFVSALVFVPRDRFSTSVRQRIGEHLSERFGGYIAAFYPRFDDGPLVRVHFIVARRQGPLPVVPPADLEAEVARIVRTWSDDLLAAIGASGGDATRLASTYLDAFPAGYAEAFPPTRAMEDIARIERLGPGRPVAIDFHPDAAEGGCRVRAAIFCLDEPILLSERVPLMENLGFTVIDERTWRLSPRQDGRRRTVVLHDMLLETFDGKPLDLGQSLDVRLEEAFIAISGGHAESDGFNRLIMAAKLGWREAAMFRALAAWLRQLGSAFGPRYIADTLARHPAIVGDLVALFHLRHDPDPGLPVAVRQAEAAPLLARIEAALGSVASLDEDRILRQVLALLTAIVRTSYYRRSPDGSPPSAIAFKIDGRGLALAPPPRPFREIFVMSPRVEGVHLRFAPIARGGIRWSDRSQDYRTEVLGLAKAQQVKNAVIVPAGAKGGFYPKALPRGGGREAVHAEGVAAYRTFISAMLDLTDNIVDGRIVPPDRVVRHDEDDPYLVVAADKGTATFSDTANAIAVARGFWLGDAFASGGSAGYDHKGIGITARGAWECVKRHFREMDHDIQTMPFRVVGVGDMSGDVFGNGMLLSPAIELVAAFDHRDIFLDPDPDPTTGLAERRRLFETPRSSWADYDRTKLSPGGGVFPRSAKSITLSPEVRRRLGVEAGSMAPHDLMRAILSAETDLLWFGGIGTYVRAATETDADVGDRANDPIRVAATSLRAKVVGEGANLGMTQRGRIEAARRGIRLNTDFIDNSAGVNTSDQEVNIKIALAPAIRAGRLAIDERNQLLALMTDDVAAAVLRNNYQQSLALSLAERRQAHDLGAIARLIRDLEVRGLVERHLEALPTDHELAEDGRLGRGLSRPELAIIMSYAKIALLQDLLASRVPDDPHLGVLLSDYFPTTMRDRFGGEIATHRLMREIVATTMTNGLVNRLGPAMPLALADAAGRPVAEVAFAFMAARGTLGLADIWQRIDALDGKVSGAVQLDLYERVRRVLVSATTDFLRDAVAARPLGETIERLGASCAAVAAELARLAPAQLMARLGAEADRLVARGVPADIAHDIARLDVLVQVPSIAATAAGAGGGLAEAAKAYLAIASALRIDEIVARAQELAPVDDYERLAISGGIAGLGEAHRRLAAASLARGPAAAVDVEAWLAGLGPISARAQSDLSAIAGAREMSVARLAVAAARLAGLADAARLAAQTAGG